ncbi:MAG: DNA repair protein RecO [Planctomycetota bacterium]|jgi:DNA repair protein RecO (recombination protein O)
MSRVEKTRALFLRRHDYSETSFVVHFLTPDFGRLRALAKGAKRVKSPMNGALEPLTVADVVFYKKNPPALHILSQARTETFFRSLRTDLDRFYAAHRIAELLLTAVPPELPQPELFDRAALALRALEGGGRTDIVVFAFESALLKLMGNLPRTDVCLACEKPWKKGERALFHPLSGGALHPACAREKGVGGSGVGTGTLRLLHQFADDRVPRADRVTLAKTVAKELRALLDDYFRLLLERDLRTTRFIAPGKGTG